MKSDIFSSLRSRLILLVLIAVIPAFAFLWYSTVRLKRVATEDAAKTSLHYVKVLAANQEKVIEVTHQILQVFAQIPAIQHRNLEQSRILFQELLHKYPYYSDFVITDSSGQVLTGSKPLTHPIDSSDKPWFQRVMQSGRFSLGDYQTGRISQKQVLVLGMPVRDEHGIIVGAVSAGLDLHWLSNSLVSLDVPAYVRVEIIDRDGTVLAHFPDHQRYIGKKIYNVGQLHQFFANKSGTFLRKENGVRYLYGYQLLRPETSQTIVQIGIPLRVAFRKANTYWHQGLIWLGIASLLALTVAWIGGSYFVVNTINRLISATNKVAQGALSTRSGIDSTISEFNALARNFDRMASTLQAHESELREREEKFRALVVNSPDIVMRFDRKLQCIYVNPAIENNIGIAQKNFIEKKIAELDIPDDLINLWRDKMMKVFESGEEEQFEFEYPLEESIQYFLGRLVPELDGDGEIQTVLGVARNITILRKTQEKLHEQERQFRTLVENYPDVIGRFDRKFRHLYVNPSVEEITGVPADFYIGKRHRDLPDIPKDFLETWESNFQRVFKTGRMVEFQYQFSTLKDEQYFEARLIPEFQNGNEVQTVLAIVRDITKQKQAEGDLKKREQEFRALVENSPDLVIRLDRNLKNLYASPAVEQFFNLVPEDFINKQISEVAIEKLKATPETVNRWSQNLSQTVKTGQEHKFESQYDTGEGVRYFYTFVVPEVIEHDQVQTILAVTREITPLKIAQEEIQRDEKLLEGIFASLDEAVFVIDSHDRTIITCNRVTEQIFGYTPTELQGRNTKILHVNQEKYEEFDRITVPALEKEGILHLEFQMRRKDGTIFPTEHSVTILKDASGEWSGVVSVVRDITERKRTEHALESSKERLRSLTRHLQSIQEEERRRIARDIHDELGQMLTALQMDAIWLQRKIPEGQQELLRKTESMYNLADQSIETIQRISTNLRPSMLDDLGIESVIQWEAERLQNTADIECTVNIESKNQPLDDEISIALYRVLQESLTNVLRHADATKVSITYRVTQKQILLEIADNGRGISQADILSAHSFGLAGMRERVEVWDGTLKITGNPNQGTIIQAILPFKD